MPNLDLFLLPMLDKQDFYVDFVAAESILDHDHDFDIQECSLLCDYFHLISNNKKVLL